MVRSLLLAEGVCPIHAEPGQFELKRNLIEFACEYDTDPGIFQREDFTRLISISHRPYGKIYVY